MAVTKWGEARLTRTKAHSAEEPGMKDINSAY